MRPTPPHFEVTSHAGGWGIFVGSSGEAQNAGVGGVGCPADCVRPWPLEVLRLPQTRPKDVRRGGPPV